MGGAVAESIRSPEETAADGSNMEVDRERSAAQANDAALGAEVMLTAIRNLMA